MAGCTTPCPALLPQPPQAFPTRLARDDPVSLACCAPRGGQAEASTWTRSPGRWGAAWRSRARHQRRLLRRHGEAETEAAWRPHVPHPAGIGFALTADEAILGHARQHTVALPPGGDVLATPCVPDRRPADMGAHGRHDAAWRRPLVGVRQRSRLPPARVPPRAPAPPSASSTAPLLATRPQRAPVHVVAQSTDLGIDAPGDGPRPARRTHRVQRVRGPVALPEAVGAGRALLRDDRVQDQHHGPRDALGLPAGRPAGPLLPAGLRAPHPRAWRRHLPMGASPLMPVPPMRVQGLGGRRRRALLPAGSTAFRGLVRGCQPALPGDPVPHRVADHRWIMRGLRGQALAFPGDGG
jgi:hypothetical protein